MIGMRWLLSLSALLTIGGTWWCLPAAAAAKPNVLVILTDDTGWGEYGFQGNSEIPTPNIDSIAAGGVRFTNGYVSGPYCSPTRAGLMTGRYQTRFGHEFNSAASGPRGLSLEETTIAQRMKELGYSTCAIGKWHLGYEMQYRPTKRGFDEFFGTLANTSYYNPKNFVDSRVSLDVQKIHDPDFYTTEAFAERAVDWLERNKEKPWFLYVPFNAQHAPLEAPPKYLDRFASINNPQRRAFAAVMSAKDDAVGRILGKVRDLGQAENTLVWFLADNGGPTQNTTSNNGPLRGFKSTTWEGGVRVPFCVQWKGTIPAGKTYDHPVIQLDILPTCVAAAGGKVDPAWRLDGVDLLPYLTGKNAAKPHETLYWRFGEQWAIRHGDWKLVQGRDGGPQPLLVNLTNDIGEQNDLSAEQPEKVKELRGLWEKWNAEQAPPSAPASEGDAAKKKRSKQERQLRRKQP
jgi:arylsulfatase A-like enzyme